MSGFVVLRPEPGNARTAARLGAAGATVIRLPLFAIAPLVWRVPDPASVDALLLTSANAVRHGGDGLATLRHLPVVAVGAATADAARAAGFVVAVTGTGDATAAAGLASRAGFARLLHLAGRDHARPGGANHATVIVYAAELLPIDTALLADCRGKVALLHSARAAARFAALCDAQARAAITIAAISATVADGAGTGWRRIEVASRPSDDALVIAAMTLAD